MSCVPGTIPDKISLWEKAKQKQTNKQAKNSSWNLPQREVEDARVKNVLLLRWVCVKRGQKLGTATQRERPGNKQAASRNKEHWREVERDSEGAGERRDSSRFGRTWLSSWVSCELGGWDSLWFGVTVCQWVGQRAKAVAGDKWGVAQLLAWGH